MRTSTRWVALRLCTGVQQAMQVTNRTLSYLSAILASIFLFVGSAAGQESSGNKPLVYHIKPSDVVVPGGVPLGEYRRIIRPFENWIMVCDDNLMAKRRICNISQAIIDETGKIVFSWSLAAAQNGQPFLILRANAKAKVDGAILVMLPDRKQPVSVPIEGCNQEVCLAKIQLGPIFREHIGKQSVVRISYTMTDNSTITIPATFKGLSVALAAIK